MDLNNLKKLNDPVWKQKEQDIIRLTMQRLNIDKNSGKTEDIIKAAIMDKFDTFLSTIGICCMLMQIPMKDVFEVLRAHLDMTELIVTEAKKHVEGK